MPLERGHQPGRDAEEQEEPGLGVNEWPRDQHDRQQGRAQTSRGLTRPPKRGQALVAAANPMPEPENSSRFDNGPSQRKCRLIR